VTGWPSSKILSEQGQEEPLLLCAEDFLLETEGLELGFGELDFGELWLDLAELCCDGLDCPELCCDGSDGLD